jgi:hypothetical protein
MENGLASILDKLAVARTKAKNREAIDVVSLDQRMNMRWRLATLMTAPVVSANSSRR